MRRGLVLFLLANLVVVGVLVHSVFTLLTLLFEDCSADAIPAIDIPAPNSEQIAHLPQYIPRIIHQTWANESIPEKWQEAQKSCLNLHGDYEYKVYWFFMGIAVALANGGGQLWTNEKSRGFIRKEYPWFLETYDNYPYPIMRADAIRYFILSFYGGVYLDLDDVWPPQLLPMGRIADNVHNRAANAVSTRSSPTTLGCERRSLPVFRTTLWAVFPNIRSSCASSTTSKNTIVIGRFRT